jgi:hypothetical protein
MALKSEKKKIGSTTYQYTQQSFSDATRLFSVLAATVGESAALFAQVIGAAKNPDEELPDDLLGKLIASVLAKLSDADKILDIVGRINQGGIAYVQGTKGQAALTLRDHDVAEHHFSANFEDLPEWIAFALEVQFGNFFGSLKKRAVDAQAKAFAVREAQRDHLSPKASENIGGS